MRELFDDGSGLEAYVRAHPDAGNPYGALGRVYAGLGREEDAVRAGMRSLDLFPANRDNVILHSRLLDLVIIHTALGDHDAALEWIEKLVLQPNWVLSLQSMRSVPYLDPLRDHLRYQALVKRAL